MRKHDESGTIEDIIASNLEEKSEHQQIQKEE